MTFASGESMMPEQKKQVRGTKEWAVAEINCCRGCPHGCLYCYARYDLVEQKKCVTADEWKQCQLIVTDVDSQQRLYPGQVMFPTHHDILPENLDACVTVIRNLLRAGNRVLIVSKPHLDCISRLCAEFASEKSQLLFRFTITARDNAILTFWEPFAPAYIERKSCLEYAYNMGFATSVSVEPMLDTNDLVHMVRELLPWASHSIWLGKMNKIEKRVACDSEEAKAEVARIIAGQSDAKLLDLYKTLSSNPKIFWKESVKEVVGLSLSNESGLDI